MKRILQKEQRLSLPLQTIAVILIICMAAILSPSRVLSQATPSSPATSNASPAITSISLEFVPAASPPTPSSDTDSYFDIIVNTQVMGINLVNRTGQANVPGEGHLVYYAGVEPSLVPTWPAFGESGYHISTSTSMTWTNALPDYSVYAVQVVNNDNTPLNPPVYALIRTHKQLPNTTPERPMITSFGFTTNPPSSPLPTPGTVTRMDTVISTEVTGFNIINKYDSPASPGEGHFIYYEVVDPLITAPNESAFVGGNYSYATHFSKFTWLNEVPGYIAYSVQLVNNDDTPLELPVFAVIKTNTYPGMQGPASP